MVIWPELPAGYGWRRITYRPPYRCFSGGAARGTRRFSRSQVGNISEAQPATGLIVPGTDGFKGAAGKIIVLDGAPAGRTGVGHVDERIALSVAAVRIGAGLKEQGRQHEQHQSFYHLVSLPGWGSCLNYLPAARVRQPLPGRLPLSG